jgi:hypothetical protein
MDRAGFHSVTTGLQFQVKWDSTDMSCPLRPPVPRVMRAHAVDVVHGDVGSDHLIPRLSRTTVT